ncbi:hypothetical protein C6Y40_12115 [Alteromonas alba]|jgi:Tfp pilus assembly protein PilF|uniref:Uncharacterized protein n=1 Tax=Alteromonas alba TaxID=2079529 RepID=A0A2S9VA96_9ALTE|nr:hypothetical protein [Alteromonas alba]MCP4866382.1 hypothetical protein [Alteromonas sp.]PRO73352.1 hypothetical protein C6Y40_12115 [Alteromonas alba]HAU92351.1 hypothetical protein [Alteromonas sp.]HCB17442.1 hypothetical protein [Alteromonas sp.]HCL13156.1 hypothetical protein [Alteromonas sp.]|tara:strand:+ start:13788 stop:13970 length:183 start_codon:yes stop_codon:yes gene_type:complete
MNDTETRLLTKYRLLDEGHQQIVEKFIDKILAQDKDSYDANLSNAELVEYAIELERQSDA